MTLIDCGHRLVMMLVQAVALLLIGLVAPLVWFWPGGLLVWSKISASVRFAFRTRRKGVHEGRLLVNSIRRCGGFFQTGTQTKSVKQNGCQGRI